MWGANAQGETGFGVGQHAGDCADVYPTLQCSGKRMANIVLRGTPCFLVSTYP